MNAFLVDDEYANLETLKNMLQEHCPDILVTGMSGDFSEAVLGIQKTHADILFLDIELGAGQSGFGILDALKGFNGAIIFVAAHEGYAITAFRYGAVHYLLKPIDPAELVTAVNRIKEAGPNKAAVVSPTAGSGKIAMPYNKGFELIVAGDIMYVEGQGSYAKVAMQDGQMFTLTRNLKFVSQKLAGFPQFIRVHKSFLINSRYISAFIRPGILKLDNQKQIPVSNTYKAVVAKLFE
jgi:two-component system, LytTR family, response regulator